MSVTPLAMFVRTTVSLVKFNAAFQLIRSEDHTIYTLEIQGSELRKLWSKVKCTYDKCLDYLTTLAGVKTEDIDEADEKYEASYQAFVKCLSAINQKLDQLKAAAKSSPSLGQSVLAASTLLHKIKFQITNRLLVHLIGRLGLAMFLNLLWPVPQSII